MFKAPAHLMVNHPALGMGQGNNGFFIIPYDGKKLCVISSDGAGWEHVSVSIKNSNRCPTWPEMCYVKSLFWDEDSCVVQYHPPKSQYVNNHDYCLHMWRPYSIVMPMPPSWMVGIK